MTIGAPRQNVFMCYSHADAAWLKRFQLKLEPALGDKLSVWSDKRIAAGADWHAEIEQQLNSASAALLLVSDTFLSSRYINTVELPVILERHAHGGLDIFWVPITSIVNTMLPLSKVQAAWDLDKPLICLKGGKRDEAIKIICDKVIAATGQLTYVTQEHRDQLADEIERMLKPRLNVKIIRMPVGDGDFTIVYPGEMDGRAIAAKVLVERPLRRHLGGLQEFVRKASDIVHPCVAPVYHAALDRSPPTLLLEYVNAPRLGRYLAGAGKPFDIDQVVILIQGLASAIEQYHRLDLTYGPLMPNDIFYDRERALLRIPALGISNYLAANDPASAGFPKGPTAATYLVPERYFGATYGREADQYSLGLIAFEMIQGTPPVRVEFPSDLEKKRKFFADPAAFAGDWKTTHPMFAEIIFRMLAETPQDRWRSMQVVAERLGQIESAAVAIAKQSYIDSCHNKPSFYAKFYVRFFEKQPETRKYFRNLDGQYAMLDRALQLLLNFTDAPRVEPTMLTQTAEAHQQLAITHAQFDDFAQSFFETLREEGVCELVIDAWKLTVRPGVDYLKRRMASTGAPTK